MIRKYVRWCGGTAAKAASYPIDDKLTLRARLPQGYTGIWTAIKGGSTFDDPQKPRATAENFAEDENILVWKTISLACPLGDADTVRVLYDKPPVAMLDSFATFTNQPLKNKENVLKNDSFFDMIKDRFEWLDPLSGRGDFEEKPDGDFDYDPGGFFGTYRKPYRVCSQLCPTYCDTETLKISVTPERQPILVTPNGDGKNDVLVIKEIAADPDQYPENEFVIFNADGAVLYHTKPYRNDWPQGAPPPTGTYWYRLIIEKNQMAEGRILVLLN